MRLIANLIRGQDKPLSCKPRQYFRLKNAVTVFHVVVVAVVAAVVVVLVCMTPQAPKDVLVALPILRENTLSKPLGYRNKV